MEPMEPDMEPDDIRKLALHVANTVALRLRPEKPLSREEREDLTSQACLGIWKAMKAYPGKGPGYYFIAGRNEATRWFIREWKGVSLFPDADMEQEAIEIYGEMVHDRKWKPTEEQIATLRGLMQETRKQNGARNRDALDRDIDILIRICEGWSNKEIADDLGMSNLTIRTYRQRLVNRLQQIQRKEPK